MSAYLLAKKRIPDLLEKGPLPKFRIGEILGLKDQKSVGRAIDQLCEEGKVRRLGRADENGLNEFRAHAIMFALPGWQPKKKAPVVDSIAFPEEIRVAQKRTIPAYRWPAKSMRGNQ